ncbi:MAG: class I SAM-dependent methyltransferase [Clostridia bacterium]|nr:class I SAM-dependent methyltransferase [Clostridia bacterium]
MNELAKIREAEKQSHIEIYSSAELFKEGSWLQKPVKTVTDIIPLLSDKNNLRVLDLGCGIGRNCIPIAKSFKDTDCRIDCVDILDFAIEKLYENAKFHSVENYINGIISPIENFEISQNTYDLIIAVSALEHIDSKNSFIDKLTEIDNGLEQNGIVCLIINSNVCEKEKDTGTPISPQFEVNLPTEELLTVLRCIFKDYQIIKETTVKQQYDIPRGNIISALSTDVVTFVAKKSI